MLVYLHIFWNCIKYFEIEILYFPLEIFAVLCYNIKVFDFRGGSSMNVSYNKLWKLMIDRKMNKSDLRELTGIGTNTLAKLSKDQQVSMEVLMKICSKLNCDISDICEFVEEEKR